MWSMLRPAKITKASYAALILRAAERTRIVAIDDWSNQDYFDADTFPLALTVAKSPVMPSGETVEQALDALMTRPSSALRAPSPRERGEGEHVVLPLAPRERGEEKDLV